jgi:SAM-dependent methyltransferase
MSSVTRHVESWRFLLAGTIGFGILVGSFACGSGEPPPAMDETRSSASSVEIFATEPAGKEMAVENDVVHLAPFVTTPYPVIEIMLGLAEVDPTDVIYDIGCGDGRIVIMAAQNFGARGVGIDIDPDLIAQSREIAEKVGVSDRVEFRLGDATTMDLSEATVVTVYLIPESNAILRPQFDEQLRPGTYVVSHNYVIPGWEEKEIGYRDWTGVDGELHTIWAYRK